MSEPQDRLGKMQSSEKDSRLLCIFPVMEITTVRVHRYLSSRITCGVHRQPSRASILPLLPLPNGPNSHSQALPLPPSTAYPGGRNTASRRVCSDLDPRRLHTCLDGARTPAILSSVCRVCAPGARDPCITAAVRDPVQGCTLSVHADSSLSRSVYIHGPGMGPVPIIRPQHGCRTTPRASPWQGKAAADEARSRARLSVGRVVIRGCLYMQCLQRLLSTRLRASLHVRWHLAVPDSPRSPVS